MAEEKNKPQTKKAPVKKQSAPIDYVHIDEFLQATAEPLSGIQKAGFKAYMAGKHYQHSDSDFKQHLHKYLNK